MTPYPSLAPINPRVFGRSAAPLRANITSPDKPFTGIAERRIEKNIVESFPRLVIEIFRNNTKGFRQCFAGSDFVLVWRSTEGRQALHEQTPAWGLLVELMRSYGTTKAEIVRGQRVRELLAEPGLPLENWVD